MAEIKPPLSNLQLKLLKLFNKEIPNKDLLEIKNMIGRYFAEKAMNSADKIWDEKGYNNEQMDNWLEEENKN